jgi:4-hydroxythreonine-4-phosphate dehydrogenase
MTSAVFHPLVLTQGDPSGIGPELLLHIAAEGALEDGDCVVADPELLAALAERLGTTWAVAGLRALQPLLDAGSAPGMTQVQALERGVDLVLADSKRALVTAPIDKAKCREEGFGYAGHTEYLAARTGGPDVTMLMCGTKMRVVLATIHVPLRRVHELLSSEDIVRAGSLLSDALVSHFGVPNPRIGVLGLNPHAGERGMLGDEESWVIAPAVERLRAGVPHARFEGPLSADTAFHAHMQGRYDGIVAMYHDQGLAPFKLIHFTDGVNMTLGLPFVRTSPDHGTAVDIAGKGIADPSSMLSAVNLARRTASSPPATRGRAPLEGSAQRGV